MSCCLLPVSAPSPGEVGPVVWPAHDLLLSLPVAHGEYGFLSSGSIRLIKPGAVSWLSALVSTLITPSRNSSRAVLVLDRWTPHGDGSLGLRRVYKQNSKLVLIQTAKQRYTGGFSASLRYIERKSAIEGTTKPRGGFRYLSFTVTVYLFPSKIRCLNYKLPNKGIPWISASLRYIERKSAVEGTKKNKKRIPIYRLLSRYSSFWQKR